MYMYSKFQIYPPIWHFFHRSATIISPSNSSQRPIFLDVHGKEAKAIVSQYEYFKGEVVLYKIPQEKVNVDCLR